MDLEKGLHFNSQILDVRKDILKYETQIENKLTTLSNFIESIESNKGEEELAFSIKEHSDELELLLEKVNYFSFLNIFIFLKKKKQIFS